MRRGTFVRAIDAPGPIETTIVEVKVKGQSKRARIEQEKQSNAKAHRTLRLNAIRIRKEMGVTQDNVTGTVTFTESGSHP